MDFVSQTITNNSLQTINKSSINESTESSDISVAPAFIGKLIEQTLSKSILKYITSVVPLTSPTGYVYSMLTHYEGKDENYNNNTDTNNFDNTKILFLSSSFNGNLDTEYTLSNGAVITVEYFEENKILVKVVFGSIITSSTFTADVLYTVQNIYSSRIAVKKLFKNYSLVSTEDELPKSIGIKSIRTLVDTKARKLKSTMSQEAIQDIESQYKEKAGDLVADIMSKEIALEMDKEVIDYMRSIATVTPDLQLDNTGSVDVVFAMSAITTRINKELVNLSKKHGKNITGFVVCSNNIVSALISAGVMTFGQSGNLELQILSDNNNAIGIMQSYITVIQDKFAEEDYVLVGWKQDDKLNGETIQGNAGVIFSPYTINTVDWVDPETGRAKKMIINRYGYTRNAFDESETGSDFFTTFNVDFSQLVNY